MGVNVGQISDTVGVKAAEDDCEDDQGLSECCEQVQTVAQPTPGSICEGSEPPAVDGLI